MSTIPPNPAGPIRAIAGSVVATAAALAAGIVVGCGAPTPPRASPATPSVIPAPSANPAPPGDGLLVAVGIGLQVTEGGALLPFLGPVAAADEVSAARGVVVVAERAGGVVVSRPAAPGSREWQPVPVPDDRPASSLIGLSPDGRTLAMAVGEPQARSFNVVLVDLGGGETRSIQVGSGLDGPPIWIGPATIAVHAVRDGGRSGFTRIDVASGAIADFPSYGVALATSADGSRVAVDEATSGDMLVGNLADLNDAGLERMTRLPHVAGGVDRIAMSGDGRQLAVVRRTETGSTIELFEADGQAWAQVDAIEIRGDRAVSIAWLE